MAEALKIRNGERTRKLLVCLKDPSEGKRAGSAFQAAGAGDEMIVVKSVSRFVPSTVDTLTAACKPKECGVEVYFEGRSIYTPDGKGEGLPTIMSGKPHRRRAAAFPKT